MYLPQKCYVGEKVLTYYGNAKQRKELRTGWTKLNAFHVCITSYQLAVQDAASFKRKKVIRHTCLHVVLWQPEDMASDGSLLSSFTRDTPGLPPTDYRKHT